MLQSLFEPDFLTALSGITKSCILLGQCKLENNMKNHNVETKTSFLFKDHLKLWLSVNERYIC